MPNSRDICDLNAVYSAQFTESVSVFFCCTKLASAAEDMIAHRVNLKNLNMMRTSQTKPRIQEEKLNLKKPRPRRSKLQATVLPPRLRYYRATVLPPVLP